MTESFQYSVGHDIISKYERELIDSLPELYPHEAERQIVEQVLIPEFREKLEGVFEEFLGNRKIGRALIDKKIPVTQHEIPTICSRIDQMIKSNSEMLATDTFFKPVLQKINEMRPKIAGDLIEFSRQSFINSLWCAHIPNLNFLRILGVVNFPNLDLPPYGRGIDFSRLLLGRNMRYLKATDFHEISEGLALKEVSQEELLREALSIFEKNNISDYSSLIGCVVSGNINNLDFYPYSDFFNFLSVIFGHRNFSPNDIYILDNLAGKFNWAPLSDDQKINHSLNIFSRNNVTDRTSLFRSVESLDIYSFNPSPYRSFSHLISDVLQIDDNDFSIYSRIADKFGWD